MSYLVLARKYRPRVFADVVGQEVVTGTLRGAIAEGRVGHAYLFCGPRGTGKTTTARIFAKALNCEKGPAPDPCGICERCLAADAGSEIDIIEVDAASHTGVDYVREMREQAAYMPLRARFKIYLIDEVHMLSKGAFNALLKTLEEPPPHVKFLFATTELERLPETIVSRCQLLRLVPLNERTIVDRLSAVFEAEGVKAAPGVVAEIARRARGGMRDALSLADQLLSLCGNELEVADLAQLPGDGGAEELDRLLDLVEAGDMPGLLTSLPKAEGGEVELLAGLLDHVRGTLLVHLCGAATPLLEVELEARKRMHARAQRLGVERLQIWLEELLQARERMRLVPGHARLVLEVTLLDLARPETNLSLAEISERLLALEQRLEQGLAPRARASSAGEAPLDARPPRRDAFPPPSMRTPPANEGGSAAAHSVLQPRPRPDSTSPAKSASPAARDAASADAPARAVHGARAAVLQPDAAPPSEAWNRCLEELRTQFAALSELLKERGRLASIDGTRALVKLGHIGEDERLMISDARNVRACSQALSNVLGRPVEVAFESAAPEPKAQKDAFTARVSDLFGGRIEDDL
jgi:DNA polymerase-3 subunit gamma/tau